MSLATETLFNKSLNICHMVGICGYKMVLSGANMYYFVLSGTYFILSYSETYFWCTCKLACTLVYSIEQCVFDGKNWLLLVQMKTFCSTNDNFWYKSILFLKNLFLYCVLDFFRYKWFDSKTSTFLTQMIDLCYKFEMYSTNE